MKKGKSKEIEGIVIPAQWDDDGNVTGISIQTIFEEEFLVESSRKGIELLSLIQKRIKATGLAGEKLDGKPVIRIDDYYVMPDFPGI